MSYTFNLPNITATTPEGKLQQMQSFLYKTVEQLNWALNSIEFGGASGYVVNQTAKNGGSTSSEKDAVVRFNDIKSLIIKSADIVSAYYEEINRRLVGEYVAVSDFGTYTENTALTLEENSKGIKQNYENLQEIVTDITGLEHSLIDVKAHINTGVLYYDEAGAPVYGLEIGQKTTVDDVEVFNKFARFTSDRLSFYDQNGYEAAYISDKKLYISHIEVIKTGDTFTIGKLVDTVLPDGSVVTR